MADKTLPFSRKQIEQIIETYPTPFHIYDEKAIRANAQRLIEAFAWAPGFKEFFAVKALPNPRILQILREEGLGADCSSYTELLVAEMAGIAGEEIMLTSNNTPADEYKKARQLGAIINLDDITHIPYLVEHAGMPEVISFRYNPGALKDGNSIIGKPEEAKYGLTYDQMFEAYKIAKEKGARRFGLHTMVASNELNVDYFVETATILFQLPVKINQQLGIDFEFINLGGGIGIPYRPEDEPTDIVELSAKIRKVYEETLVPAGLTPRIFLECGRLITGPYGYLVTRAIHRKNTYKHYIGVDACMADLMRPGMYGAYHHITVLGKENAPKDHTYDVVGSLCENNDKFAINRELPEIGTGDILVIHDTGAHGHAMGFNYNGKLRPAELLLKPNGSVEMIRRAETPEDYFATLRF